MGIPSNQLNYKGHNGVWMLYDYDTGPYMIGIADHSVKIIERLRDQGHGRIGFLPIEMDFREAVDWWEKQSQKETVERPPGLRGGDIVIVEAHP